MSGRNEGQGFLFDGDELARPGEICTVAKDTHDSGLEAMDDRALRVYKHKICQVLDRIEALGLPLPGEQLRLITRRTFNAIAFLQYIAHRDPIEDLKLVVYSINHAAAILLVGLLDSGRIQRAEILISNLRNTAHCEKEEIVREMFIQHPRISLFYCSSHAKVMACRTASGNFYCIEGSANLSFNSRVENYIIDNDRALFEFAASWMQEIREYLKNKGELAAATTTEPAPPNAGCEGTQRKGSE